MSEETGLPALRWAWLGTVGYQDAWELQRAVALARRNGELNDDAVLLLEHPPVYTMGRQGEARHLGEGEESLIAGHPAHGDVHHYLRALEAALIATAAAYGVEVTRRPPYTGVWAADQKLGAIGVKLAGGVTTHGVALNVATDLGWFDRIIPCGIDGSGVASLESLGAPGHTPELVAPVLAARLATAFGRRLEDAGALTAALRSGAPASSAA
jgi:lipoate-protein ligase B